MECEQLEELNLQAFALELRNGYGNKIVYGVEVSIGSLRAGTAFDKKDIVDRFAEKFGFGQPDFFSAMSGDYEVDKYYELDEDKFKEAVGSP